MTMNRMLRQNTSIITDLLFILCEKNEITLFALWKGELNLKDSPLARVLGSEILAYLPQYHEQIVVLNKTCLTRLDLGSGAIAKHLIVNGDLHGHLFRRMTKSSAHDPHFLTFMDALESYPCVHGCISNERFLCWNLEFASGWEKDVAWYIVDMLGQFSVTRVVSKQPDRHFWMNAEHYFMGKNKLFMGTANSDAGIVTMNVMDLPSGQMRVLPTIEFEKKNLRYDAEESPGVVVGSIAMTNHRVWLAVGSCNLDGEMWKIRGNMIYDTELECVVGSIDNKGLLAKKVNPRAPSFYVEDVGFFMVGSFSSVTWLQLNGDVVKLQCDSLLDELSVVKVACFGDELCVIASDVGVSGMNTGGKATFLVHRCGLHDFVKKCKEAVIRGEVIGGNLSFQWPTISNRQAVVFGGAFCLC